MSSVSTTTTTVKLVWPDGGVRRAVLAAADCGSLAAFRDAIKNEGLADLATTTLSYKDDEGDKCLVHNDTELQRALQLGGRFLVDGACRCQQPGGTRCSACRARASRLPQSLARTRRRSNPSPVVRALPSQAPTRAPARTAARASARPRRAAPRTRPASLAASLAAASLAAASLAARRPPR